MELRIPFTNLSLRMNLSAKSDGRWLGSADDLGTVFNGRVTEEKALGIDAVFACVNLYAKLSQGETVFLSVTRMQYRSFPMVQKFLPA